MGYPLNTLVPLISPPLVDTKINVRSITFNFPDEIFDGYVTDSRSLFLRILITLSDYEILLSLYFKFVVPSKDNVLHFYWLR